MIKHRKDMIFLVPMIPFLVLVILYLGVPLINLIMKSFLSEGGGIFTLENYKTAFTKKYYLQAITNSLIISVISSIIGIVIGIVCANSMQHTENKTKSRFLRLLNVTSNFSGVPLAFAYIILLGNTGVLVMVGKSLGIDSLANFDVYSMTGLILTYIYFQIPLATLLLLPAFEGMKKEWTDAAKLLKANSYQYWLHIGIPILLPTILSTLSVLFANVLAAYATGYALLTNNIGLLPIRISEMFVGDVVQRPELGSALAVIMMVMMMIATLVNSSISRKLRGDNK